MPTRCCRASRDGALGVAGPGAAARFKGPSRARVQASRPEHCHDPVHRAASSTWGYVGKPELLQHPYAFPTHGDLEAMPPTLIVNAEIDDLRPSGEHFAGQLARAGVDVAVFCEPGTWHGYLNDFSRQPAGRTVSRMAAWIAERAREAAERRIG